MKVEVEVGVDHPPRRHGGQRRHDDLLPQPKDLARGVVEPRPESLPVRSAVKELHSQDAGTGAWIGLAAVQYLVERAEFLRKFSCVEFRHVTHARRSPRYAEVLSPR